MKFKIGDEVCFISESLSLWVREISTLEDGFYYRMECEDGFGFRGKHEELELVQQKIRRKKLEVLLDE